MWLGSTLFTAFALGMLLLDGSTICRFRNRLNDLQFDGQHL